MTVYACGLGGGVGPVRTPDRTVGRVGGVFQDSRDLRGGTEVRQYRLMTGSTGDCICFCGIPGAGLLEILNRVDASA